MRADFAGVRVYVCVCGMMKFGNGRFNYIMCGCHCAEQNTNIVYLIGLCSGNSFKQNHAQVLSI